jgi:cytidyltransferase-like protein
MTFKERIVESKKTVGLFVGRFQPLTKAHIHIIEQISNENDRGIIFLVKANKKNSVNNPFNEDLQRNMINEVIPSNIDVVTLPSAYFVDYINTLPNDEFTIYAGTDRVESYSRFSKYMEHEKTLEVKEVTRTDEDISATKVREALKSDDYSTFETLIDERVHKYFEVLKDEINK